MNPSSYTSTLLKAFDILDCFSSDSQEIGIKDISQKIDMPQSSVYRIIQSLEFAGMIYQNRENRKYRLGPKFIALSGRQSSLSGYMDIAMKYMKLLGHETSETVNLAMLDCDRIVYLHRVDSPHVLRPNFSLMERYSAVQTGLGLVLLADLNSAGLQWVYQNNADTLHIPYEEFTEQIAQTRSSGWLLAGNRDGRLRNSVPSEPRNSRVRLAPAHDRDGKRRNRSRKRPFPRRTPTG